MSEAVSALRAILKITAKNASEDLFFKSTQSVLGILFQGGVQIALGNFAIAFSFADLITILARAGYKAYKEVQKTKVSGTAYNIHKTVGGVLVAENSSVISLRDLPINLPERASFPVKDIFNISPSDSLYSPINSISFRQLDSVAVFKSLINMHGIGDSYLCHSCLQTITITGNGAELGHDSYCPKNPYRHTDWCEYCKKDLRKYPHDLSCPRANIENLRRPSKDQ